LPDPLGDVPAVHRSVEVGVLVMAGAELGELTPPGATRPQAVMSQPQATRIRSNLNREPPTEEALCPLSRVR